MGAEVDEDRLVRVREVLVATGRGSRSSTAAGGTLVGGIRRRGTRGRSTSTSSPVPAGRETTSCEPAVVDAERLHRILRRITDGLTRLHDYATVDRDDLQQDEVRLGPGRWRARLRSRCLTEMSWGRTPARRYSSRWLWAR